MKKRYLIVLLLFVLSCRERSVEPVDENPMLLLEIPANFPKPVYDLEENPLTQKGFELGKALFYDGILSRNGQISCGFCHIQGAAFTQHGHRLSHGIDDKLTMRNSLPIQNLAWQQGFFWDGGVAHLDLFAVAPIENPNEMDESLPNVLDKLRAHPEYPRKFKEAFGSDEITTDHFLKALAQFQLMLVSGNSRYDKYVRGEDGVKLTAQELQGMSLFKDKCSSCHSGELFTDFSYRNNGLFLNNPNTNRADTGRERITLNESDRYKFRVPSLRNAEYTFPFMHDGRFVTLESVLEHYANGVQVNSNLDPLLRVSDDTLGIPMTDGEKQAIIAFILTLSDESFISDTRFSEF